MKRPLTVHGLTLFNLNPNSEGQEGNEGSLMLLGRMHDLTFVLSGDAPQRRGNRRRSIRFRDCGRISSELGHHGDPHGPAARWLETLKPKLALNSSGLHNTYQHPHPEVVRRLEDLRIPLFDTRREGDIRIVMTPICNFLFTARRGFAIIG